MERPELTIERLNGEYLSWTLEFGEGKNKMNLRFAQYIDFKYNHKIHEYLDDPFYYESATKVYDISLKSLQLQNKENTL